jgi:hypothetical protein
MFAVARLVRKAVYYQIVFFEYLVWFQSCSDHGVKKKICLFVVSHSTFYTRCGCVERIESFLSCVEHKHKARKMTGHCFSTTGTLGVHQITNLVTDKFKEGNDFAEL